MRQPEGALYLDAFEGVSPITKRNAKLGQGIFI